jgi:hypothetical protein
MSGRRRWQEARHNPAGDRLKRALRELREASSDYEVRFGDAPHLGVPQEDEAWERLKDAEAEVDAARLEWRARPAG